MHRLTIYGALIAFGASLAGCSTECGNAIYPDYPAVGPLEAMQFAVLEGDAPPGPVTELIAGRGEVAQPGRQLRVRLHAFDRHDRCLGEAEIDYLFPAFDKDRFGHLAWGMDSGEVPLHFSAHVAGMRVGGQREFKLPYVGDYDGARPRVFRGRGDREPTLEVPRDEVRLQVELIDVCKPTFCVKTTFSIPSVRERKLVERGCP